MKKTKKICVYSASSTNIDRIYYEAAEELGKIMAQNGITLINGAGNCGLMGAMSDATLQNGGEVIGIIPQFMVDNGWHHKGLSELIITENMHERKTTMANMSDGVIAMPGGCGTLEELMEIITWKQLGIYTHPIVILNINGYYNPLITMLEQAIGLHFMSEEHASLWHITDSPSKAVELICHHAQSGLAPEGNKSK